MKLRDVLGLRSVALGLLTWAIPFAISFAFYGPGGELAIPLPLFKSLMVVFGGGTGALMLALFFRPVRATALLGGAVGLFWLAINLLLDLVILVPMMGTGVDVYFADIGLRYLMIPIMAVVIGYVAERQSR